MDWRRKAPAEWSERQSLAALARLGVLLLGSTLAVSPAHAATFVVDSTGDAPDATPGDTFCQTAGAVCTLRAAIQEANALALADVINFNIAPAGAKTIVLGSARPAITSVVTIDGTTQPGFVAAAPFAPVIELNAALGGANTLSLQFGSSGSTVRGLCINRSPGTAIRLLGTSNNVVAGNFLGTDLAGTAAGTGNQVGVYIGASAVATNDNRIGGTAAADRNVISANTVDGIQINAGSGGAANNVVYNNYIGVDVNGTASLGNTNQGVALFTGFAHTNNAIGAAAANAGNVLSGNGNDGVLIGNAGTTGTLVQGNFISTNAAGTAPIPNLRGVEITVSVSGNTIGGAVAGAGNVISGNTANGILINGASNNNTVHQNIIGRNATNTGAVANGAGGVRIEHSSGNAIGGTGANDGNIIAGNDAGDGVAVVGAATGNAILRNSIFSNGGLGIDLGDDFVTANDVGDSDSGANNLQNTAVLSAVATDGAGNVHLAGPLPNLTDGVVVDAETQPGFIVGGPVVEINGSAGGGASGLNMVLSTEPSTVRGFVFNGFTNQGLALRGTAGGHTITGNYLGTDVSGTVGVGSGTQGIFVGEIGGAATTIGGDTAAERNIISANTMRGRWRGEGRSGRSRPRG